MRILVTGGLGFIGWEVTRQALGAGHDVVVVDDMSANVVDSSVALEAGATVEPVPVQWVKDWDSMREPGRFDVVVHCASPVGAATVIGRDCVTEITTATDAAVSVARSAGAVLVNVSSSEVYGREGTNSEGDPLVVPDRRSSRVGYAVGKLAGEHQVAHAAARGLPAVTVRPFNVVGPLQAAGKGFVLPRFCEQAWAGGPLTVFGDGAQQRAFTHVADIAGFLLHLAGRRDVLDGRVVNAGNASNTTSIQDLALRVTAQVVRKGGPTSPAAFMDGRDVFGTGWEEAAAGTKLPDPRAAVGLGWAPVWDLWSIVAESVDHYKPIVEVAA